MTNVLASKMKRGQNGKNFKNFLSFSMTQPKLQLAIELTSLEDLKKLQLIMSSATMEIQTLGTRNLDLGKYFRKYFKIP